MKLPTEINRNILASIIGFLILCIFMPIVDRASTDHRAPVSALRQLQENNIKMLDVYDAQWPELLWAIEHSESIDQARQRAVEFGRSLKRELATLADVDGTENSIEEYRERITVGVLITGLTAFGGLLLFLGGLFRWVVQKRPWNMFSKQT